MRKFKQALSMLLVVILVLSVFAVPTWATDTTDSATVSEITSIRWASGYQSEENPCVSYKTANKISRTIGGNGLSVRQLDNGDYVYCIQPGVSVSRDEYIATDGTGIEAWEEWLTESQREAIALALKYGFPNVDHGYGDIPCTSYKLDNSGVAQMYAATQIIVWEIASGLRQATAPFAATSSRLWDAVDKEGNDAMVSTYEQISELLASSKSIAPDVVVWDEGNSDALVGQTLVELEDEETTTLPKVTGSSSASTLATASTSGDQLMTLSVEDSSTESATDTSTSTVTTGIGSAKIIATTNGETAEGFVYRLTNTKTNISYTGVTDKNGEYLLKDIPTGVYKATQLLAPGNTAKKSSITFEVHDSVTDKIEFENTVKTVGLNIEMTDKGTPVENAAFNINGISVTGEVHNKYYYTNSEGVAVVNDLYPGTYTITQRAGSSNVGESQEIKIAPGEFSRTVRFGSVSQYCAVSIYKYSDDQNVSNVEFEVVGKLAEGGTYKETKKTDSTGLLELKGLKPGVYTFTEKNTDAYIIPETFTLDLTEPGQDAIVNTLGYLKTGSVIVNVETEHGDISGISFNLSGTAVNGKNINMETTTNSAGRAYFVNIPLSGAKPYLLVDTSADTGFETIAMERITVENNDVVEITVSRKLADAEDEGNDDDSSATTPTPSPSPSTPVTPEPSPEVSPTPGTEPSPSPSAEPSPSPSTQPEVSPSPSPETPEDEECAFDVELSVVDLFDKTKLEGVKLEVSNSDGKVVAEVETDKNGAAEVTDLAAGTYSFVLAETVDGYVCDQTKFVFELSSKGKISGETEIFLTPTNVVITVLDEKTGEPIEGATVVVYDSYKEKYAEKLTDENGQIVLDKVPAGTYGYKVTSVPTGATVSEDVKYFGIDKEGNVVGDNVSLETAITVEILVVNKADVGEYLEGASFEIYDEAGKVVCKASSNKNGKVLITTLEPGKYTYKQVGAPTGYAYDDSVVYSFTINDDGDVDGDLLVKNEKKESGVVISVQNADTKKGIKGAKISVYDIDNKVVATGTSDENGEINLGDLDAGTYTFIETTAPSGYVRSRQTYSFTVNKDGSLEGTTVFYNKLETPTATGTSGSSSSSTSSSGLTGTPKTGNTGLVVILVAMSVLCVAGIAGTGIWMYRKREE